MHLPRAMSTSFAFAALVQSKQLYERQSCSPIHIFGARGTTEPAGVGASREFIDLITQAYPQATTEAIDYPAIGGDSYGASVEQGTTNIANQINTFNEMCPDTELVIVGYSQGGQIGDNALCGSDTNPSLISIAAEKMIKAAIWAGNPRNSPAESAFQYGTCTTGRGFAGRPGGFSCPTYAARVRSYCDSGDEYCCGGNEPAAHGLYGQLYGQNALDFVKSKLDAQS